MPEAGFSIVALLSALQMQPRFNTENREAGIKRGFSRQVSREFSDWAR
jgi:hypothetical protein